MATPRKTRTPKPGRVPTITVTVRVTPEVMERFDAIRAKRGLTQSAMFADMVTREKMR